MGAQMKYNKKQLAELKNNYFLAKALYETVKEIAEEIQKKILEENEFYETQEIANMMVKREGDGNPKRILNPFNTYMMDMDTDFQKYLDLTYAEYLKAGIADERGRDYIPEARAKEAYYEAEKQLINFAIDIIPAEMSEKESLRKAVKMLKYRDKVLDLVLRLEC